jgi:hypothetical protein
MRFLPKFGFPVAAICLASCSGDRYARMPDPAITEGARASYALATSASFGPGDRPGAGTNAWPQLSRLLATVGELRPAAGTDDDPAPFDPEILYLPRVREQYRARGKDIVAMERESRAFIRSLESAGVFRNLQRLSERTLVARPPMAGHLMDRELPDVGYARLLARTNAARMELAAVSSDWATFSAAFDQTLTLGRIYVQQTTLLEQLVGTAVSTLALERARVAVTTQHPDPTTLRRMLASLDKQASWPPFSYTLAGERLFVHDSVDKVYSDPDRTPWQAIENLGGSYQEMPILVKSMGLPTRDQSIRAIDEIFDQAMAIAPLPPRDRVLAALRLEEDAGRRLKETRQLVAAIFLPNLGKAACVRTIAEAMIAGTRLTLAIELFRAQRATYPKGLGDLAPDIVRGLPPDPYSQREFRYRILMVDGAQSFLLYSVGLDGKDDAGQASPEGPNLAGTLEGDGFDLVLVQPRSLAGSEEPLARPPVPSR